MADHPRVRSLARAVLVLDIAYCATSIVVEPMPGWKMFESAEELAIVVTDRSGREVDPRAFLPLGAQILDERQLMRVVTFVCEREPGRAPLTMTDRRRGRVLRFDRPSCEPDAPR